MRKIRGAKVYCGEMGAIESKWRQEIDQGRTVTLPKRCNPRRAEAVADSLANVLTRYG